MNCWGLLLSVQENKLIEYISTKKGADGKIINTHGLLNGEKNLIQIQLNLNTSE